MPNPDRSFLLVRPASSMDGPSEPRGRVTDRRSAPPVPPMARAKLRHRHDTHRLRWMESPRPRHESRPCPRPRTRSRRPPCEGWRGGGGGAGWRGAVVERVEVYSVVTRLRKRQITELLFIFHRSLHLYTSEGVYPKRCVTWGKLSHPLD
jgi:hypothetical protein